MEDYFTIIFRRFRILKLTGKFLGDETNERAIDAAPKAVFADDAPVGYRNSTLLEAAVHNTCLSKFLVTAQPERSQNAVSLAKYDKGRLDLKTNGNSIIARRA
jgi:hypothetical protein